MTPIIREVYIREVRLVQGKTLAFCFALIGGSRHFLDLHRGRFHLCIGTPLESLLLIIAAHRKKWFNNSVFHELRDDLFFKCLGRVQ